MTLDWAESREGVRGPYSVRGFQQRGGGECVPRPSSDGQRIEHLGVA